MWIWSTKKWRDIIIKGYLNHNFTLTSLIHMPAAQDDALRHSTADVQRFGSICIHSWGRAPLPSLDLSMIEPLHSKQNIDTEMKASISGKMKRK